jgi:hypothetical protein
MSAFGALRCLPSFMRDRLLAITATVTVLLLGSSCAGASDSGCALGFVRSGTTYYPHQTRQPLPAGEVLGEVSTVTCDDGNGQSQPETREAVAIRGLDPTVAFLVPDEGTSTIFAAGPPDGSELPSQVQKLLAN